MRSEQQIKAEIERIEKLKETMRAGSYLRDQAKGRVDALKWVIEKEV